MMIKVLIADDSITARQALALMFQATSDIQIVAEAKNGKEAIRQVQLSKPDIILMDLFMPDVDGLEATEEIMALQPTPIIIMSGSLDEKEASANFQAMRLGALALVSKPVGPLHADYKSQTTTFLNTLRALSSVKVIHHLKTSTPAPDPVITSSIALPTVQPKLIAIATSTGGPGTLAEILKQLPANFPIPIVVVQHISAEFLNTLVKWLDSLTELQVKIAQVGEIPQAGYVYFAPGNTHLCLNGARRFEFNHSIKTTHMPSADVLFESVAKSYGDTAIGLVLTGMGDDGAKGLLKMYERGAYTIAQDESSSIIYGMPREALAAGAVKQVASATELPEVLKKLAKLD